MGWILLKMIKITTECIKLGQLLKFGSIISSGSEEKEYLQTHKVLVNNQPENRRGRKLFAGDKIEIDSELFLIQKDENK